MNTNNFSGGERSFARSPRRFSRPSFGGASGPSTPRPSIGSGYRSGQGPRSYTPSHGGYRNHSGAGSSGGYRGGSSSRGGFRRGGRSGGPRFTKPYIDFSRFINTAKVVETIPDYVPEHVFNDFALHEDIKRNIAGKGYVNPTPIQDRAIPQILLGHDVVGIANTGTGKTAAFLLPLVNKVALNRQEKILIMVPTRELAQQIEDEFRAFARGMRMFSVTCIGGASIRFQMGNLRRSHNFVIGTPGRIKDLYERGALELSEFSTVVLDEADRMLDMGFINDMKMIMSKMRAERHTLFFSATFSKEIEMLVNTFLKNPVRISVKTRDTSASIEQDVVRYSTREEKPDILHKMLLQPEYTKVLVFGETKHGVEKLSEELNRRGHLAVSIHGDKSQSQRYRALKQFKEHRAKILVATDVAARGLDIPNVTHVINYDTPATQEDYVHRIGRTGRAGKTGKALTFIPTHGR